MALAHHKPTSPARIPPEIESVVEHPNKHEIYDHNLTPLWSLDAFISGSPWTLECYFRQRLGVNDGTKKLDINIPPSGQAYEGIEGLELITQSALTSSYVDKDNVMSVTGSALMFSFLIPNVDDYFIAQSNLARLGLFRVTNVNRRTHERESIYIIEYTLEEEVTKDSVYYQNLYQKRTVQYVFSKQRLIENLNPILLKSTYSKLLSFRSEYLDLVRKYFRDFVCLQTMTVQLPGQDYRIVDPMLLDFVIAITAQEDAPELSRVRHVSLNNDPVYEQPNIWNCLINRRAKELPYSKRKMGLLNPRTLVAPYFSSGGSFIGADFLVRPFEEDQTLRSFSNIERSYFNCKPAIHPFELKETTNPLAPLTEEENFFTEIPNGIVGFLPVKFGEDYIFGESFFNGVPESLLEIVVLDYLNQRAISLDQLSFLISLYPRMNRLEQFYYGPLLMLLLRESERSTYA